MLNGLSFRLDSKIGRLVIIFLLPVPIIFSYAFYSGLGSIERHLKSIAKSYSKKMDAIISDLHEENENALYVSKSCSQIQEELLFENLLREMLIIENKEIICSSKRGKMSTDVSSYYPDGKIITKEQFFDLNKDAAQRTLLVINADKNNPYRGAVSIVDQSYIKARLDYQSDTRISKFVVKLGDDYYPQGNITFTDKPHSVLETFPQRSFSVQIMASDEFVASQIVFYLLSATPVSLLFSMLLLVLIKIYNVRTSLVDELKKGLSRKELFLVYQPIITTKTQEIKGYEALIRWNNPKLGFVKPDNFISVAEDNGLINDLTSYVIEQLEKDIDKLPFLKKIHVSINVPPSYLIHDSNVRRLIDCGYYLTSQGIQLVIEITERQLLDTKSQQALKILRSEGICIAIDDFGTGHTALSILQHIDFDYLKIDKCFTDTIGVDSINAPVLNSIIDLAHQLQVEIVAEGIEEAYQAEYLEEKKVNYQQGYYYSKPLFLEELDSVSPDFFKKSS